MVFPSHSLALHPEASWFPSAALPEGTARREAFPKAPPITSCRQTRCPSCQHGSRCFLQLWLGSAVGAESPRAQRIRRGSENHSSEGSVLRRGPYRRARSEVSEGRQGRGRSTGDEESLAVLRRHVMTELLDTERVYVEELLCILEGYAAEMDNPLMTHLISTGLQNKKDVLFGNMEEIYHFHHRKPTERTGCEGLEMLPSAAVDSSSMFVLMEHLPTSV
ncbi:guanine nucleotide exchange factor DBS [Pontoporia blainvillei]|uniref:Guanine nucleotide exchange factor DBS n=1 Tax=Pontoporia blainvillei TaxID=48723 RepID=A0ABX0SEN4_PONBL|nr:guanine nucleotide exchange factor DBS [Pontoporia blainvillei]